MSKEKKKKSSRKKTANKESPDKTKSEVGAEDAQSVETLKTEPAAEKQGVQQVEVQIAVDQNIPANKPESLKADEDEALKQKADDLIQQLQGGPNRKVENGLKALGQVAQTDAAAEMKLLERPLGTMMAGGGAGKEIGTNLLALRLKMDKLNPHKYTEVKWPMTWVYATPVIGPHLKEGLVPRALEKIKAQYEPISEQKDAIIQDLRGGKEQLLSDNIDMDTLYDNVKKQQEIVQKNAYLGELLIQRLTPMMEKEADPTRRREIEAVLHAVSMRTQDLHVMLQGNIQFFVSIDLVTSNNQRHMETVERIITLTDVMLNVGLTIQMALQNQLQVMGQVSASQEYLGNLMASTAATVRTQGADINKMANQPVIAMEKVKSAFNDLMAAMDETEEAKRQGIESAKTGISELKVMNKKLAQREKALTASRSEQISTEDKTPASIEA